MAERGVAGDRLLQTLATPGPAARAGGQSVRGRTGTFLLGAAVGAMVTAMATGVDRAGDFAAAVDRVVAREALDSVTSGAQDAVDWLAAGAGTVREKLDGEGGGAVLSGPARIIDGDTLEVAGARVRLFGIDAPESAQRCLSAIQPWPCGQDATRALAGRIGSEPVACEEHDRDRYGRIVAVCRVAGEDVNAWMVSEGWAFAYRTYSLRYVADEIAARAEDRGIWRGRVVAPWDWRAGERLPAMAAIPEPGAFGQPGAQGCVIKGNISASGERIYHVPGGGFYERTGIDTGRGERWFCSEAEAREAGWRKSRR